MLISKVPNRHLMQILKPNIHNQGKNFGENPRIHSRKDSPEVWEVMGKKWGKNSVKLGKNARNRLRIFKKVKFWYKKIFKKEEISWKEELSHPILIIRVAWIQDDSLKMWNTQIKWSRIHIFSHKSLQKSQWIHRTLDEILSYTMLIRTYMQWYCVSQK